MYKRRIDGWTSVKSTIVEASTGILVILKKVLKFVDAPSMPQYLSESVHNVFRQFLHTCKITLHKPLTNTLALESSLVFIAAYLPQRHPNVN